MPHLFYPFGARRVSILQNLFYLFTRNIAINQSSLLLNELHLRFSRKSSPRILVDGLWFSRPIGGISRVWERILSTWRLPGLIYDSAPICLIERDSCLAVSSFFLLSRAL